MRFNRPKSTNRFLIEFESILIEFSIRFQRSDLLVATIRFEISVRIRIWIWIRTEKGRFYQNLVEFAPKKTKNAFLGANSTNFQYKSTDFD